MGVLRFGAFSLDRPRRAVLRDGAEIELRSQSFDVLDYLARHAGRVISKDELIEAVWPTNKPANEDDSLVQCITDIRRALGDGDRRIIRTYPRKGYMFASEVSERELATAEAPRAGTGAIPDRRSEPDAEPQSMWQRGLIAAVLLVTVVAGSGWLLWVYTRPATMMAAPTIAVLPFNAGGVEHEHRDAAAAFTDDIETELARTPRGYDMRLRSARGYKAPAGDLRGAGRALGVRYLALGSIRREGEVRHVNVQLVEAESGRPVWAEPFTYAPAEPLAQVRLAARIARALHVQVLKVESRLPLPANPEAGHYVILGRAIIANPWGLEGTRQAKALFDKAYALDPDMIPALLGYGRTRVNLVLNRWVPGEHWKGLLDEAEPAIRRAIELDSKSPGVRVLSSAHLRALEKHDEAVAEARLAVELHPLYPLAHAELGRARIEVGEAGKTVEHIKEAIRLSPNDVYISAWTYWAGMAEAHVGNYESALKWFLDAKRASPSYVNTIPWLAVVYAGLGKTEDARGYLDIHRAIWRNWTIAGWRKALPTRHPVVMEQRERIVDLLCRLGAPGCRVAAGPRQ
jgi:DNA-binding winged helix-turn-helix (wHTH) protein/TolB-like protein